MSEPKLSMAKVNEIVGELYINNRLVSDHLQASESKIKELTAKNSILEDHIRMLQGSKQNGSDKEE